MKNRKCLLCGKTKLISSFPIHSSGKTWRRRWCKPCYLRWHVAYHSSHKKEHAKYKHTYWRESLPTIKKIAYRKTRTAIDCGVIKKSPCGVCGSKFKIQAHHDDYKKPLVVRWLCQYHHMELHRNRMKEKP